MPLCREIQRAGITPHQALVERPAGHQANSLVVVTRMRSSMFWSIVLMVGKHSFEPVDPLCFQRFLIQESNLLPALSSLPAGSLSSLPGSGDLHPMWHCSPWAIPLSAGAKGTAVHDSPPAAVLLEGWSLWGCPAGEQLFSATEDTQVSGWAEVGFVPVLRAPVLIGMCLPKALS